MTLRYGSWGIILDDIVFPDGRTAMAQPGGGGLYAAMGMRLWLEEVGIIASVGQDFDPAGLEPLGLDTGALSRNDRPTPRAWQLFEPDGTRTQIPRVSQADWSAQLVPPPSPATIPSTLEAAHYALRGHPVEEEMLAALAAAGLRLGGEPIVDATFTEEARQRSLRLLAHFAFFSPGEQELEILLDVRRPLPDMLRALTGYGPPVIALRRGSAGSIVYEREGDRFWQVPPAPATVVDVTGAGNAYCGGFLAGLILGEAVAPAAARAAASASIVIEQVGPPALTRSIQETARRRHAGMLGAVRQMEEPGGLR